VLNPVKNGGQLSLDTSGNLLVSGSFSVSGGNAAASTAGAAVPVQGGYTAFNSGGLLVGVSATNPLPIFGAFVEGTVAAGTSATKSLLIGGVTATTAPTPTAGQQIAMQLDRSGNLRASSYGNTGSFTTVVASGTGAAPPSITVPAATKYLLKSTTLRATVANSGSARSYTPNVTDSGGNQLGAQNVGVTAPINAVSVYTLAPGLPLALSLSNANASCPFPELFLGPGFVVQISAPSGVAGDALVLIINVLSIPD
jgi:hypothetical protein